jgi:hypothetical protein
MKEKPGLFAGNEQLQTVREAWHIFPGFAHFLPAPYFSVD